MTRDELEYSISQYLDGTLPPLERDVLEERLAADAEARALLGEYRTLNAALKDALSAPAVRWDRLQASISAAVAREEPPVRHYSIKWVRHAAGVAVAASVVIATTIAIVLSRRDGTVAQGPTGAIAKIEVQGPQPQAGVRPVIEVAVGPSPELRRGSRDWRYAEGVVWRPSRVVIASSFEDAQDARGERY